MKTLLTLVFTFTMLQFTHSQSGFSIKVDHYAILVADLDVAAKFYGEVLGLSEIENQTKNPSIRWFALSDGREIHLINRSKEGIQLKKDVHLAFCVNDLDGYIKYLDGKATYYENWPGEAKTTNTRPDGIRQIYIQDPDGYWIEVNDVKR